jgi:hypothetical protein
MVADGAEKSSGKLAAREEFAPGRSVLKPLGGRHLYEAYLIWDDKPFAVIVAKVLRPDRARTSFRPALTARGRRATTGRWQTPGRAAWRARTVARALNRTKAAVLSPGWKPPTQEWGPFRTVNWTPHAESPTEAERKAASHPGLKPGY